MLDADKVNAIWPALEAGKVHMQMTLGNAFADIGTMADMIIDEAMTRGPWSREEVLEAWLYQALGQVAACAGVPKRRKVTQ